MKAERIQKKVSELKFGDIVTVKAPFEENTRLYYNGHNPIAVKGELVKDRNGDTAKFRPVMVIGVEGNQLIYAPLTSSHKNASSDDFYQYKVIHNDAIPNGHRYTTYVETNSIRELYIQQDWNLPYHTTLEPIDRQNLTRRFMKLIDHQEPIRDSYRYITPYGAERISQHMEATGHEKMDHQNAHRYQLSPTQYLDVYDSGIIKYHHERTLDEVKVLHGESITQEESLEITL